MSHCGSVCDRVCTASSSESCRPSKKIPSTFKGTRCSPTPPSPSFLLIHLTNRSLPCRTSELLEQICEGTDPNFFYGALWDCVISNPSVRLTAVDFALNHFNKKLSMEDQLYMIGTDIDTMVSKPPPTPW